MKERIIILSEAGGSGHFIASLLQTLHDESFYDSINIECHGSMDTTSGISRITYRLYKLVINNKNFSIYPESIESMDILYRALEQDDGASNHDPRLLEIHVIHYRWITNIFKFLTLPNTKIILVNYNADDCKRMSVNSILKNLAIDRKFMRSELKWIGGWQRKKYYLSLLSMAAGFEDQKTELDLLDDPSKVSPELINAIIQANIKYADMRSRNRLPLTFCHPNLTILNFNDLYSNKEVVMKSLSDLTNYPINNSTRLLYDEYLSKQPNIDLY
jgi:hypothetical protein